MPVGVGNCPCHGSPFLLFPNGFRRSVETIITDRVPSLQVVSHERPNRRPDVARVTDSQVRLQSKSHEAECWMDLSRPTEDIPTAAATWWKKREAFESRSRRSLYWPTRAVPWELYLIGASDLLSYHHSSLAIFTPHHHSFDSIYFPSRDGEYIKETLLTHLEIRRDDLSMMKEFFLPVATTFTSKWWKLP